MTNSYTANVKMKQILKTAAKGIISRTPLYRFLFPGTGGTNSSRYCYSVWMRHMVTAASCGVWNYPETVIELGPGDSMGIGLSALLSGAGSYIALDSCRFAESLDSNMCVLNELIELFSSKTEIPSESEFPQIKPLLDSYSFPENIINAARMKNNLDPSRLERIKKSLQCALTNKDAQDACIRYYAPWDSSVSVKRESADMIFSQAVMEHVSDLERTYQMMHAWLKPGGIMSHQIDFRCHGTSSVWNGHWTYSDFMWKIIQGKRPFPINRTPHSVHIDMLKKAGFVIIQDKIIKDNSGYCRDAVNSSFRFLSDEDFRISGTCVIAQKRNS